MAWRAFDEKESAGAAGEIAPVVVERLLPTVLDPQHHQPAHAGDAVAFGLIGSVRWNAQHLGRWLRTTQDLRDGLLVSRVTLLAMIAEQIGIRIHRILPGDDVAVLRLRVGNVAVAFRLRVGGKRQQQDDKADQCAHVVPPDRNAIREKWRQRVSPQCEKSTSNERQ